MNIRFYRQRGVLKADFVCRLAAALIAGAALPALMSASPTFAQGIRLNEDIISDPLTGAAILGYDPVSFFIEGYAVMGRPGHQLTHGGKAWHFASQANMKAFEANPDVYVPAYGGYDAVGLATGALIPGSPAYFLIAEGRVFLFRHAESREAFLGDPAISAAAEKQWPELKRQLTP